ncbi:phnA protein [Endozoicomonas sp. Mp262]|uniref:phnA protein n=1 Tax=Endozoicomonas sp. Mp262 TaxID=2919499 RepID=UPI0021D8533E
MAKGLKKHQERQGILSLLGKDLARRSKSCCEICEASGVPLKIYEVAPVPEEPDFDHCLMACEECWEQLASPKRVKPDHWRCLNKTIWSTLPGAQVVAIRQLRSLSSEYPWAAELLEQAYLEPEVLEWADSC